MGGTALRCCSAHTRGGDDKIPLNGAFDLKACLSPVNPGVRRSEQLHDFTAHVEKLRRRSGSCAITELGNFALDVRQGGAGKDGDSVEAAVVDRETFVSFAKRIGFNGDAEMVYDVLAVDASANREGITVASIRAQTSLGRKQASAAVNGATVDRSPSPQPTKRGMSKRSLATNQDKMAEESTRSSLHAKEPKDAALGRSPPSSPGRRSPDKRIAGSEHAKGRIELAGNFEKEKEVRPKEVRPSKEPTDNQNNVDQRASSKKKVRRPSVSSVSEVTKPAVQADDTTVTSVASAGANSVAAPLPSVDVAAKEAVASGPLAGTAWAQPQRFSVVAPPEELLAKAAARARSMGRAENAIGFSALKDGATCVIRPLPYEWGAEDRIDEPRSFIYKGRLIMVPLLPLGGEDPSTAKNPTASKVGRGTGWQKVRSSVIGGAIQKMQPT